jgi:hypothetical protein
MEIALSFTRPQELGYYLMKRPGDVEVLLVKVVHPPGRIWHVEIGGHLFMFKSISVDTLWSERLLISR